MTNWLAAPEVQRALALLAVLAAVVWLTLRGLRRSGADETGAGASCGGGCGCAKPRAASGNKPH